MKNVLIAVLVVAVIVLGYLAFKPKTNTTFIPSNFIPSGEQTTPTINPAASKPNNTQLKTYTDPTYSLSFSYDATRKSTASKAFTLDANGYKPGYKCTKNGQDYYGDKQQLASMGFADISNCQYMPYGLQVSEPTVSEAAENLAKHKLHPFGINPTVTSMTIDNEPAKVIYASADEKENEYDVAIVVKLPKPILKDGYYWNVITITTTRPYTEEIISSLKFK